MKKPEITVTLDFKEDTNIEHFEEVFLNTRVLSNCGASLIRIRRKENEIIIDFYNTNNKKRILKYKKLLISLTKCINSETELNQTMIDLTKRLTGTISDMQGTMKQFEDLQKCYEKLANHE